MSIVQKLKMSYYLPYEIQADIMKRLPVKSLVQFKSVSKQWKSIILSSEFIADYNAWNSQHCLLVTCADNNGKKKHELIVDDDTFPLRKLSHTIPSSVNLITDKVAILGSSQGLFCYYGYPDGRDPMAVIWNPSVPKSVDIVVPRDGGYKTVVGFGVCPRTFDPMLVKITYIETVGSPHYNYTSEDDDMQDEDDDIHYNYTSEDDDMQDEDDDIHYNYTSEDDDMQDEDDDMQDEDDDIQVEVFTLSSGAWKRLSIDLPRESIRCTDYSVNLDGFIYWHAYDIYWRGYDQDYIHRCQNMIMSFDMTSEKFTEISLPDSLVDTCHTHLSISKRLESLVVLDSFYMAGKHEVWMMEGGVKKSFTKLFTIEAPEASIGSVLGFRKSGEPIIRMENNGSDSDKTYGVYLYEPNSRHISYVGISAERYIDIAGSCTNTLLLLDR